MEAWFREWAATFGLETHVVNQTAAVGAINLVGPRSRELLRELTSAPLDRESLPYPSIREIEVAGVPCRVLRLGFTGELGFELHHPSSESVRLWDALLSSGASFGIRPHGLDALRILRLEKGHIIVGQDTDFDSTPTKLGLEFAVRMDKQFFVGKGALERLRGTPSAVRLARLAFEGAAPVEGTPLRANGHHAGYLTSACNSPVLGHGIALGWLRADTYGTFPEHVLIDGVLARVVQHAFYDPDGERLRA